MKNEDPVTEDDLDSAAILGRGGANFGDEDFAIFCCPNCREIYLLESEVDTVYLDSHDLSQRAPVSSATFHCERCGEVLPRDEAWIGDRARDAYKVTRAELRASEWSWILKREK